MGPGPRAKWSQTVTESLITTQRRAYTAPRLYVGIFYLLLAAWAVLCLIFLNAILIRFGWAGWYKLAMIAFVLFCMCYFATAIAYKIEVGEQGDIRLTSLRRIISAHAVDISEVESPHLPFGFIRFRLEGEKAYLFCITRSTLLQASLEMIRRANPDIRFKRV